MNKITFASKEEQKKFVSMVCDYIKDTLKDQIQNGKISADSDTEELKKHISKQINMLIQ